MAKTGATKVTCRIHCQISRKQNAKIYASYESVTEYRYSKCTPPGIENVGKDMVFCPMQSVLHQMCKRVISEDCEPGIVCRIIYLHNQGYKFVLCFKYGSGIRNN